ncbi:hypothetical protein HPB50_024475 [Hyalomma asiaticum]|uniref:Uncharacterized protein n=1 Tax=Hyalomma asiaticum TaxID=266040 RepID=A0ACB7T931_HYAAI|nr:hypothetical protein HPB50_024475 [Hyalomma asiaticum]
MGSPVVPADEETPDEGPLDERLPTPDTSGTFTEQHMSPASGMQHPKLHFEPATARRDDLEAAYTTQRDSDEAAGPEGLDLLGGHGGAAGIEPVPCVC